MKVSRDFLILCAIFLLYAVLHFINLDKRIVFGWDQEQFTYQIKAIITQHDFTLLGPRVNNDRGFFLAPYFTYLLVPFYFIGNLHPSVLIYFLILFNIVFFIVSYHILKNIFSKQIAFLFLLLWPLNSMLLHNDITAWWPLLIPFGVIITWYLLWRIYKEPQKLMYWALIGVSSTFFINMHFQFIFIIFLSVIFLLFVGKTKKIPLINPVITVAVFLLGFFPLLVFDLRHEFLNFKLFYNFFLNGDSSSTKDYLVWIDVFGNFMLHYVFIKQYYLGAVIFGLLTYITYQLSLRTKGFLSLFFQAHIVVFIATALFFTLYAQRPSEYYFFYLAPFILILIIQVIMQYNNSRILYGVPLFILLCNVESIYQSLSGQDDSLYYKNEVAQTLKQKFNDKKFHVSYAGPPSTDTGFHYLLEWHGVKQSTDLRDPLVQVVRPAKKNDIKIGDFGIRVPKELK